MNHLKEWSKSCVDDLLIRLNVKPLEGDRAYDYLFYADNLPRRNDGRVTTPILKRYQHIENGGWWCSGINILTGDDDNWGCFKPISPRISGDRHKAIKYEHPPKVSTGLFALRVPVHLWQKIASRYDLEVKPCDLDDTQEDLGFWQWFLKHPQIPLCITEGAKKAGALITAGYSAIALPGVYGGYRSLKDEHGNKIGRSRLLSQLLPLIQQQRPIYIVFDQDSKPKTIQAVNAAVRQTGYLLRQQRCPVKVVSWNADAGKGVDDLIANHGQKAFDAAYNLALPLDVWKAHSLTQLTYDASIQVNQRYLADLEIPKNARLIGIKSPKGTGKTQALEKIVEDAISRQKPVLVIGHRIQLVKALCQRFGLNYITEVRHNPANSHLGYGLCIDSLHPHSQAQFNALDWENSVVIIDEIEQVLWHTLHSSTCRDNRVAILKSFKTLMQNSIGGEGQVYVADADLSDTSLEYLQNLAGVSVSPFIVQNDWKPTEKEAWNVYSYSQTTPQQLVQDLESHIREGGKPFVCLSAQKIQSQWGTCTLEAYFQQKFPQAKILRIDSESLTEPNHPAYQCITKLDEILPHYDIVLASPTIETGVSIDLKGHFTSVWGIAQGIQSENSVRQAIGRIRENVPRYLWMASYGFQSVGNGSTSIPALLTSGQRMTQANIRLLQQADFEALDDLDTTFQAESLLCWAKMAVRFNAAIIQYRESVLAALRKEGHFVKEIGEKPEETPIKSQDALKDAIKQVRNENYQAECDRIATSEDITEEDYSRLKKCLVKTPQERHFVRKYELKQRYGIPITPKVVKRDDTGWYGKLRLHYFLTVGRQHLAERDATVARYLLEQGQGDLFLPDFNASQLGITIGVLDTLGVPVLLNNLARELRNTDEDLQQMSAIALSNRSIIKTTLGIGLAKNSSPITVTRRFLDLVGYKIKCIRCEGDRKKRIRVYRILDPKDQRLEVFQHWLTLARQPFGLCDLEENFENNFESVVKDGNYIQLSLDF